MDDQTCLHCTQLRQQSCPSLRKELEGRMGSGLAKEGVRLFGAGICSWPGCWPWPCVHEEPRLVGLMGISHNEHP